MAKLDGIWFADNFVQEVPSGSVNGTNDTFTLSNTPAADSAVFLYSNGLLKRQTADYTISGASITFNSPPASGEDLYCLYVRGRL